MRHIIFSLILVVCSAPIALAQDEMTEPGEQVLLVLDSSGSMWGQIDGTAKYEIARNVLDDMLEGLSESHQLGLLAYGHRREGDCTDIEMLAPPATGNRSTVSDRVEALRPLGMTPITDSLRAAADAIAASGNPGSVVILTDGLETCDADPCAAAAELAASGINIRAHVIGFDLGDEDVSSLRCIADETGGLFMTADSSGALGEALGTAMDSATATRNVTLRAVDGEGALLSDEVEWNIYDADDTRVWIGIAEEAAIALAPGTYRAEVRRGDSRVTHSFDVPEDEAITVDVVFATGTIAFSAQLAEGMDAFDGRLSWIISDMSGEEVAREAGSSAAFTLPAGDYTGRVSAEDLDVMFEATFNAGAEDAQIITLNAGTVTVSGVGPTGEATARHVSWTVYPAGEQGARSVAREIRRETTFLLAAGSYRIVGTYQDEVVEVEVILAPGAAEAETVTFQFP